jgi:hypothetical protein
MRELVEAAVRAAGAQGLPTTIIMVGGQRTAIEDAPGRVVMGHAEGVLPVRIGTEGPSAGTLAMSAERDRLAAAVASLARERDSYSAEVRKLEAKLAAAAEPAANGNGHPPAPAAVDGVGAVGSEPIAVLGLDEKTLKVAAKMGCTTTGSLYALYRSPEQADKDKLATFVGKLTKDARIEVGERLLGRAPPATHAVAVQGDGVAGAASGAPAEHKDRLWQDRLAAARRKETAFTTARTSAEEHRAGLLARWPACIGLDPDNQEQVTRPAGLGEKDGKAFEALRHHYSIASGDAEVTLAQVQAILWACGLSYDDNDASAVDGALKRADLVHLMETAPAPAPEGDDEDEDEEGSEVEESAAVEAT